MRVIAQNLPSDSTLVEKVYSIGIAVTVNFFKYRFLMKERILRSLYYNWSSNEYADHDT